MPRRSRSGSPLHSAERPAAAGFGVLAYAGLMTTCVDHRIEAATEFLAQAHACLAAGDLLQASEQGWNAVECMVKAVAEDRGWRHASPDNLYRVISRLAGETSDKQLGRLFRSADALHWNAYEGWFTTAFVAGGLEDAEEIIRRLSAALS